MQIGTPVCSSNMYRMVSELRDAGLKYKEISELTNLHYNTITYAKETTFSNIEKAVKKVYDRIDFYRTKNKICKLKISKYDTVISLQEKGFTEWEISRLKQ